MVQVGMQRKTKRLASVIAPDHLRDETAMIETTMVSAPTGAEITVMTVRTAALTEETAIANPIGTTETEMTVAPSGTIAVVTDTPTDADTRGTDTTEKSATTETTDAVTVMADVRSALIGIGETDTTGTAAQSAGESRTGTVTADAVRTAAKADLPSGVARTEMIAVIAGTDTGVISAIDTAAAEARTGESRSEVPPKTVTSHAWSPKRLPVKTMAVRETTIETTKAMVTETWRSQASGRKRTMWMKRMIFQWWRKIGEVLSSKSNRTGLDVMMFLY
mmetsp:Transcript_64558/g.114008  ORF Transcript_64558/g.114008 Transcript_64558/m.114008 type:complete len:277 (-) Transcript_64558:122-952(-)